MESLKDKDPLYREPNDIRGQITHFIGSVTATGSYGNPDSDEYVEFDDIQVNVDENNKTVIFSIGEDFSENGMVLPIVNAKALLALIQVAINYVEESDN